MRQNGRGKIGWTRTELQKFAEYDELECDPLMSEESYMERDAAGSSAYQQIEKAEKKLYILRGELKALMGATRFHILMNDRSTLKAWRGEISARYIAKHPEMAPGDCRPGWE